MNNFCLNINYKEFNNSIIKNYYLQLLISKLINYQGSSKYFI